MALTHLIYASRRLDRTPEALDDIFEVSRRNNLRDDITGALIVSDEHFVQLLEGDPLRVSKCLTRIMQDQRHTGVELVSVDPASFRLFAHWSMRRIEVADLGKQMLKPFLIGGEFQPLLMTPMNIRNLCRVLSLWTAQESGLRAAE